MLMQGLGCAPTIALMMHIASVQEADNQTRDLFCPSAIAYRVADEVNRLTRKRHYQPTEEDEDGYDEDGPPKKKKYIRYDRERAYGCVMDDYLGPTPTFDDRQFERFFRITRQIFEWLVTELAAYDRFWTVLYDCTHRRSNMPVVKCLAALKLVCYGISFSAFQDYFQMGESTARQCVQKLMHALVEDENIQSIYLRPPSAADAKRLEDLHFRKHGIHGMFGSLDVNQLKWGNCPTSQRGQHVGRSGDPTLGLEVVADYNLWIWHWCFGWPGKVVTNNR